MVALDLIWAYGDAGDIRFTTAHPPHRLHPKYFTNGGTPTEYLQELGYDVGRSWNKISDAELKGLFVGGSHAEGTWAESSDLDIVIYRREPAGSIPADRSELVADLADKYQILKEWGRGKKPEDVDFIITELPFGRMFSLTDNYWVEGLKKHPNMSRLREHQKELPLSYQHFMLDLGWVNQYFWGLEKKADKKKLLTGLASASPTLGKVSERDLLNPYLY